MSKLRQLLGSSLGSLLRGKPDGIGPWIARARKENVPPLLRTAHPGTRSYRALRRIPGWRGPRYIFHPGGRQRDLLAIGNELGALVRANAPLVEGLSVAALEQRRHLGQSSRRRLTVLGLTVLGSFALFAWDSLNYRNRDPAVLLFAIVLAALPLLVMRRPNRLESIFLIMRDRLASGMELSAVLASFSNVFPPYYVGLVQAGEDSGKLSACLEGLNATVVRHMTTRQKLLANFGYLGLVAFAQFWIMLFIAIKVFPVFAEILDEFGSTPGPVAISLFSLVDYPVGFLYSLDALQAVILIVFALCSQLLLLVSSRYGYGRLALAESVIFRLPWVRQIAIKANLAPAASVLALLTEAGVPLDSALDQAADAGIHPHYRRLFRRLRDRVRQGEALSAGCARERRQLPGSFGALIGVGELSGLLPDAFAQLADLYAQDVVHGSRIASDMVIPAGVLVLAAMTLWFEAALFGTMTAMSDAILGGL